MRCGCRLPALLLPLLMSAATQAQSGSSDPEAEPRISCSSHITTSICTLTCNAVGEESDSEDDEDAEADAIEFMKACYTTLNSKVKCVVSSGDTISFTDLSPVIVLNVTFSFKGGRTVAKMIDLKKIVKPKSPWVFNVTFHREPYQAVIYVLTPYQTNEYLTAKKQLFQLQIWNSIHSMLQNMSSDKIVMRIDGDHLRKNSNYQVKVRAIPQDRLQGTWSDWSEPYDFFTPAEKVKIKPMWEWYVFIVFLVIILVVTSSIIAAWKNRIFTYMWPNIPQPKHTLVQIWNPNTGLLNVKPDIYSVLKFYPVEDKDGLSEDASEPLDPDVDQPSLPCSSQSSDSSRSARSVSTEDLELSAMLGRSSSDEDGSLLSAAPSPVNVPGTPEPERNGGGEGIVCGVSKQEEGYVTMSSFHQINKPMQKQ